MQFVWNILLNCERLMHYTNIEPTFRTPYGIIKYNFKQRKENKMAAHIETGTRSTKVKFDYLGLVACMYDELGIGNLQVRKSFGKSASFHS